VESLIPNVAIFGFFPPLRILFEEGVPDECVAFVGGVVNEKVFQDGPRISSPELLNEAIRLAQKTLLDLVFRGELLRDPWDPNKWIYEPVKREVAE